MFVRFAPISRKHITGDRSPGEEGRGRLEDLALLLK
jgi:hypothetical protein